MILEDRAADERTGRLLRDLAHARDRHDLIISIITARALEGPLQWRVSAAGAGFRPYAVDVTTYSADLADALDQCLALIAQAAA